MKSFGIAFTVVIVALWLGVAAEAVEIGPPSKALVDAAKSEGQVTIYASTGREVCEADATAFTEKYGIKVNWTRKGGPEIVLLVDTELRSGKLRADVIGTSEQDQATTWGKKGVLIKYQPESVKLVIPEFRDPAGVWVPKYVQLLNFMYNTKKVKKDEMAKTYKDLLDPKWGGGRLSWTRPRGSGTGTSITNVLVNTYGWSYFETLAKNKPLIVTSGSAGPPLVINGEVDMILTAEHNYTPLATRGEPVGYIYPSDVIPASVSVYAVTRDAIHPNAAKLFVDFVARNEVQSSITKKLGLRTLNIDVNPPEGTPKMKDLKCKVANMEWLAVPGNLDREMDRWDQLFGYK